MSPNEVMQGLHSIFADIISDDVEVTRNTSAKDVPDWDSLAHIRLILAVERAFGIKFMAAEIAQLNDVGDLVDLISTKTGA